jgi:NADH-quinone oxidoreductase subunit A
MHFYINEIQKETTFQFILIFVLVSFILSCILFLLSYFLVKQNSYDEKISAYECGFVPFEDARNKFEVRFYIVAILFLIFDIEVIYLFP